MENDLECILFSEADIKRRVSQLGRRLATDYAERAPLVLGVLTGAFPFTSDLVRAMRPVPRGTHVDFVRVASYGGGTARLPDAQVRVAVDLDPAAVRGRHVVVVDDIADTGRTLAALRTLLLSPEWGAASCAVAALLDKRSRREVPLKLDYVGFDCPDAFVVGYGLDYDGEYRTLSHVGVLRFDDVDATDADAGSGDAERILKKLV